jgi:hypothetical protein
LIKDLRSYNFSTKLEVYQHLFDHYTEKASHRMIFGLKPEINAHLRDYAVATKGIMVWLDPDALEEKRLLNRFFGLLAWNSPYLGWWPKESSGVVAAAKFGIPVFAADWSANLTVFIR